MGFTLDHDQTQPSTRSVPTTGMRGGLGRTLLTAFLILTILPLALIGWYASHQNRRNLQTAVTQKLQAIATLQVEMLRRGWIEDSGAVIETFTQTEDVVLGQASVPWDEIERQHPHLAGATALTTEGHVRQTWGRCAPDVPPILDISSLGHLSSLALRFPQADGTLILCYRTENVNQQLENGLDIGETGHIYLVQASDQTLMSYAENGPALSALTRGEAGSGLYVNHNGVSVVGAYAPVALEMSVLVEQAQAEALASNDRIAATLIAVILTVALATTAIAAVVIRQITRPVVRLTESALAMAEGDLGQHLAVTSRDEIGILTYVFNQMAAELKSLYDDLEAKVVERTKRLQRANYQIQWRALQLKASLEVSQAITSFRDPGVLLDRVAELISERFMYDSVAIYLLEPGGGKSCRRAVRPLDADWPATLYPGDGTLMERALRKAEPQIERQSLENEENPSWHRRTLARIAVPLQMEETVLGALAIRATSYEDSPENNLETLEHLANQIAVALENARAYERERRAARQLEEAEAFKSRFLANMSHALREPLNSIIGFSRLMLKGLDGPLSTQQQDDVTRIYQNSQRLLSLINDVLTITQIQAGLMALQLQPVAFEDVLDSLMPTADALVRGRDITLVKDVEPDLPWVYADSVRLRQVLVRLLTNAAKFTEQGRITLRAWADDEQAYVAVEDTGVGIPKQERERIFARFEKGVGDTKPLSGVGLGLALSKEFVEMHGGQIWVESEVGVGSRFIFSVPLYDAVADSSKAAGEDGIGRRSQ